MNYIPRIKRRICLPISQWQKQRFSVMLKQGRVHLPKSKVENFNVVSFSCKRDFEEQALSMISFIYRVGQPKSWTIYSDGTYTSDEIQILSALGSFISLKSWNAETNCSNLEHDCLISYANQHPLGKKLCAYSNCELNCPTFFVDSDVVFYQFASKFLTRALKEEGHWFLLDDEGFLDSRYLLSKSEMYHVNSGFFLLKPGFSWRYSFDFLNSLNNCFEHFSEQTAIHIAMHKQNGKPFNSRQFVITVQDEFKLGISYTPDEMALRHYVKSVRHKMWQYGWEWHMK